MFQLFGYKKIHNNDHIDNNFDNESIHHIFDRDKTYEDNEIYINIYGLTQTKSNKNKIYAISFSFDYIISLINEFISIDNFSCTQIEKLNILVIKKKSLFNKFYNLLNFKNFISSYDIEIKSNIKYSNDIKLFTIEYFERLQNNKYILRQNVLLLDKCKFNKKLKNQLSKKFKDITIFDFEIKVDNFYLESISENFYI